MSGERETALDLALTRWDEIWESDEYHDREDIIDAASELANAASYVLEDFRRQGIALARVRALVAIHGRHETNSLPVTSLRKALGDES